jgi:VWFA-related protein
MRIRPSLVLLGILVAPFPLAAQLAPSPDAPPQSKAPAPPADAQSEDEKPMETLKVTARLVSLYFTVKDKHGALIPYLTQNDCSIFDEKQPQKVKNFNAETNQPLTLGILLDTSGSQQNVLPLEQQTGGEFLNRILRQKDEAFLISFDVDVNLLADYTNSPRQLQRAMDKAEINTAAGNGAGGIPGAGQGPVPIHGDPKGTLLYDAVYLASNEKLRQETGRKALILLTDGEDQGSRQKLVDAVEAAQKANAIVYVILIADRGFYGGMTFGYSGDSAMRKLAEETGGRVIDVGNNGKKLEAAFAQIEDELRTQYVASYTPPGEADGQYHHIDIQCKGDGLKVQARKGYYAILPEQ